MSQAQIDQLQLDYEGRAGSLRAVDDHVEQLVETLRDTHQLKNTLIVFTSDNGWLQGQHRITGRQVPARTRSRSGSRSSSAAPASPTGETIHGQVSNIDFAPTLVDVAKAGRGRTMDGVSLMPTVRDPRVRTARSSSRRSRHCSRATSRSTPGTVPTMACARIATPTSSIRRRATRSSTTGRRTRTSSNNVADEPGYAAVKAHLAGKLAQLDDCKGSSCNVKP